MSARCRAVEELYQMRSLAALREHLKECLKDARPAEPPEPLPYAVPVAKFFRQRAPGNAVDREIMDCLQEFPVVMPRLSTARLHRIEHFKGDQPILLRHSCQHARLPDAGHAVIRLISDSGIRQKCMPGIPSTQPSEHNPLILRSKHFRCTLKNRPLDLSELYAFDFKRKFQRFAILSISATIGIY